MTSAPAPLPPHITAEHRDRIERFVARARRIEAHSLLADRERLLRWSTGATFTTEPTTGKVSWDLPPEEQFESLAARVRPLTLPGEDISLPTVLGSLKAFVRGDYEKKNRIAGLRTMWEASRAPKAPVVLATLGPSGEPETTFEQAEIAERWLYGDLVHADEVPEGMAPIHMRYPMAVLVFGQAAMVAVAVLELVRRWDDEGLLDLDPEVWNQAPTATVPLGIGRMETLVGKRVAATLARETE